MKDQPIGIFSKRLGEAISDGILKGLLTFCFWVVVVTACVSLMRNISGHGVDDSDSGPWSRSGLSVRTDALTGLQYLESRSGHLTPRLGPDGKQISKP